MKVYCIYDSVAQEGGPIFALKNDGVAKRAFNDFLRSNHVQNKSEYVLMCLGDYDVEQPCLFGDKVATCLDTSKEDDDE